MKVLTVLGARPQFIKAAAVSRAFAEHPHIEEVIVHTGQHYDANMSDVFFEEMQIPKPNYYLDINALSHGAMTGRMLEEIEKIILSEKPDWLLVFGDTNSTIAGTLAASKLHIPIAHVEAGLRSFNMKMPEEVNRIVTDRLSTLLLCPTLEAIKNLDKEGFENFDIRIEHVGDVMYDAALFYEKISDQKSHILKDLNLTEGNFVLATFHRQENTNDEENLKGIVSALDRINEKKPVVVPLHPRTQKIMKERGLVPTFKTISPVGYLDMIQLLKHSSLVITDSGGLQKEAFFFEKPCITMREQTEWVELVKAGCNILTGADSEKIITAFQQMMAKKPNFDANFYGQGDASQKIAKELFL